MTAALVPHWKGTVVNLKKVDKKEQHDRMQRLIRRNWIIGGAALILALFCYFFVK